MVEKTKLNKNNTKKTTNKSSKIVAKEIKDTTQETSEEEVDLKISSVDIEVPQEEKIIIIDDIITEPIQEDIKTCGQLLKEARLAQNITIKKVSSYLMIKTSYLEALENDNMGEIPGKTYIFGYIRAYSNYLGLNEDEIVGMYKETLKEDVKEAPEVIEKDASYQEIEKNNLYIKILFKLFLLIILASAIMYGYKVYNENKISSTSLIEETNEEYFMDDDFKIINSLEMEQSEEAPSTTEILEGEVILEEGTTSTEESISEETTSEIASDEDKTSETATPTEIVDSTIQMIATGSVWIKLKEGGKYEYSHSEKLDIGGGNEVYESLLNEGNIIQLPSMETGKTYYLTIGNKDNVKILLNGEELELRESPKTAIFNIKIDTEKDIKEQLLRRI